MTEVFEIARNVFACIGVALTGVLIWALCEAANEEPIEPYDYDAGRKYKGMSDE